MQPATYYHFNNRTYGLENIERRRLKIATIADLNDPFELLCCDLSSKDLRRALKAWKKEMAKQYGMLCFSSDWTNPVHWSHYADKHKGICLGFAIQRTPKVIFEVNYDGLRSIADAKRLLSGDADADMMLRFLTTKYEHWRYENEYRLFVKLIDKDVDTGLYFYPFDQALKLTAVVIGAESDVTEKEVHVALGALAESVRVIRARLAFRSFEVVTQHAERLKR